MYIVNVRDLMKLKNLGSGGYGNVYLVKLDNEEYAYKCFKNSFANPNVINRLCDYTEYNWKEEFITPLYMVENGAGTIIGYLTKYDENLLEIEDCFTRKERIKLLKSSRNLITKLHDEYKYIHGDAHVGNILCHNSLFQSYLLDFDLSIKNGKEPSNYDGYKEVLQDYLEYYPFDKNVDVYLFNLSCLHILSKKTYADDYFLLDDIEEDKIIIPEMNEEIRKLSKELLLQNTKKPYSGEFIIDYF